MTNSYFWSAILALALGFWGPGIAQAQQPAEGGGVPVHLVVSVEPHKGVTAPEIRGDEVMVYEGHDRDKVADWVPAQGDHAGLELFILIDDGSSASLGTQLNDIRDFINAQPATTKVGVAYMQNGTAKVVQDLTPDHASAAKSLRLPLGEPGANSSPYFSLSDLIKRWPQTTARRSVLMITDGIDRFYGAGDLEDPYLESAIDDSVRAGVTVSAIYNPGAGHFGHSYWQTYWGQIYLSQLTEETGGEGYYIGMNGPAVAFAPFLNDLEKRLSNQYLLTFFAKPRANAGWQQIRLASEVHNADLVSAHRVYVAP